MGGLAECPAKPVTPATENIKSCSIKHTLMTGTMGIIGNILNETKLYCGIYRNEHCMEIKLTITLENNE